MIARLRYVGEHVFGGDLAAYAAAVGLTEHWLRRILNNTTRFRISTFMAFAESGIVAAEWLFCGTGPMIARPDRLDELAAYNPPPKPTSRHAVFDPLMLTPSLPKKPKKSGQPAENKKLIRNCIPIALQLFAARVANKPVILFLGQAAVQAGISPIVKTLLQKNYVTCLAMTGNAAIIDYAGAKKDPVDLADFAEIVKIAANRGAGLGEAVGRWGFLPQDKRDRSILAVAYDNNVPATVHAVMGTSLFHACPALHGVEFGAMIGSAAYVDSLVFIAHAHNMSGEQPGLFIAGGEEELAMSLLTAAVSIGHKLSQPLNFSGLRTAWVADKKSTQKVDHSIVGDYVDAFYSVLRACDAVYEGVTHEYSDTKRKSDRRVK